MMERKSWFSDKKPQEVSSDFSKKVKSIFSRENLGPLIRSGGIRDAMVGDVEIKMVAGGAGLTAILFIPENTPDPRINLDWLPPNRSTILLRTLKPTLLKASSRMGAIAADVSVEFSDFETGDAYSTYLLTVSLLRVEPENRAVL